MSTIYNDMYQDLEPTRYKHNAPDPLRLEAGLAFESFLEEALKARFSESGSGRPGEMISEEGILFNPDLIIFNGSVRVGEIKLTWMSSREMPREPANCFPPKFDKHLCQILSYCHCLETPDARLIGFFVNGRYEHYKSGNPELLAWDLQFTKREMDENWASIINHAKHKRML